MVQEFRFDFHIHTAYSCDGNLSLEHLLDLTRRSGLGVIAITDHNTMRGLQKVPQQFSGVSPLVIPGEEVSTDYGDITGIFLSEEIRSRVFAEVIDEIHDQGGLSIFPHPLRRKKNPPKDLIVDIDFIESVNSRTSHEKNEAALQLAMELKRPVIAGSDSHFSWEIGNAWNSADIPAEPGPEEIRSILLANAFEVHGLPVNPLVRKSNLMLSYFLKNLRRTCRQR
jgi:hypothetical protein